MLIEAHASARRQGCRDKSVSTMYIGKSQEKQERVAILMLLKAGAEADVDITLEPSHFASFS
jgi:hypothetical protein